MRPTNLGEGTLATPPRARRNPRHTKRRAVPTQEIARRVEEARGLVPMFARRYLGRGVAFEDLVEAGNLGVVEAAYRFDPTGGVEFGAYAAWWIRRSISIALETCAFPIVVPHYSLQRRRQMFDALRSERASDVHVMGTGDAAAYLELSVRQGERAMSFSTGAISMESPVSVNDRRPVGDRLAHPAIRADADLARYARTALKGLSDRERLVVTLRFGLGVGGDKPASLLDIGRLVGLSRDLVRQIEYEALKKIRRKLAKAGWSRALTALGRGRRSRSVESASSIPSASRRC